MAIGKLIGLRPEEIKSKLLPEEKLEFVQKISEGTKNRSTFFNPCGIKHLVMMCGDGVNDAPALACTLFSKVVTPWG
jgi:Zn2+/Cd2+-exporting ATPase